MLRTGTQYSVNGTTDKTYFYISEKGSGRTFNINCIYQINIYSIPSLPNYLLLLICYNDCVKMSRKRNCFCQAVSLSFLILLSSINIGISLSSITFLVIVQPLIFFIEGI